MKLEAATQKQSQISAKLAWLLIVLTVIFILSVGFYVGNKFFWDRYQNLSKEEYDYSVALRAVKNNPSDVGARNNLGRALVQLGEYDKALREYQRALTLDPKNLTARYNTALVLIQQKQLSEAQSKLEAIVRENPKYLEPRFELAALYLNSGKYDDALAQYEFLNAARPGNADLIYQMGLAYQQKGERDKAKEFYAKALKYDPHFSEAERALEKLN